MPVFGDPISDNGFEPGTAPSGSVFASGGTFIEGSGEPQPGRVWYEIDYNHRQAYVPAGSVTVLTGKASQ